MSNSGTVRITNTELFSLVFVLRFTSLIIIEKISLLSVLSELILSFVLLFSAYYLSKRLDYSKRYFKSFICALCIVLSVMTFFSIIDFKQRAISLKLPSLLIIIVILASAVYCASLGIQGLLRFAPLCLFIIALSSLTGMFSVLSSADFSELSKVNFKSLVPLDLIKCFDVFIVYSLLFNELENERLKTFSLSLLGSYLSAIAIYAVCISVVGKAQKYYPYPIFTMFQLGSIGSYNKLDILFTSPFLTGAFLRLSIFIYGIIRVVK